MNTEIVDLLLLLCFDPQADVDPVARKESFRALKLSRLENFRGLKP